MKSQKAEKLMRVPVCLYQNPPWLDAVRCLRPTMRKRACILIPETENGADFEAYHPNRPITGSCLCRPSVDQPDLA